MAVKKKRPFMTRAAKRSKSKRPHGNAGQVRVPSIRSRPVVLPLKERAKGLSLDGVVKLMPYRPDIFNANNVFTVTSFRGKQYPKLGKLPGTGNKAVSYVTVTKDDKGTRYHRQLLYARDPNYEGRLVDCPAVVFSCDCLPGDTRVLTDKGWQTINELLDHSPSFDPITQFPVTYIVDGRPYKGSAPFFKGKKRLQELKLNNGFTLRGTSDHRVLKFVGYEQVNHKTASRTGLSQLIPQTEWIEIKNINVGDKLIVTTSDSFQPVDKNQSYWESYFLGVFWGDGTINPPSITVCSHLSILEFIQKSGIELKLSGSHAKGRYLLDRVGKEVLKKYGYTEDSRHIVPDFSKVDVFAFLSGLIDSDGTVTVGGRATITGHVNLKILADHLVSMGVHGVKIKSYRKKGDTTNYGEAKRETLALTVSAHGMRSISHNLTSVKYSNFTPKPKASDRQNVAEVVSVNRKAGPEYVYDIHVPQIHRFVAESVVVHNCERWKYMWEYSVWRKGAAEVIFGNGEPPNITNSRMRPAACKHIFRVRKGLRKRKW